MMNKGKREKTAVVIRCIFSPLEYRKSAKGPRGQKKVLFSLSCTLLAFKEVDKQAAQVTKGRKEK